MRPPRMPRQPKLRSSCDGCGAAKLKCDRGHPVCSRCLSLDLVCVYGISRKTGKPPREKLRLPKPLGTSGTPDGRIHTNSHNRIEEERIASGSPGVFDRDGTVRNAGQMPGGQYNNLGMGVDGLDTTHADLFWPLLPSFESLEFDGSLFSDIDPGLSSSMATPESESYSTPATKPETTQSHLEESAFLGSGSIQPSESKYHDCFREAYDVLGSLSSLRRDVVHAPSDSTTSSSNLTTNSACRVPLDLLLRLNREASERLSRLLKCSCAGYPQLATLYASIISHILTTYQQVASSTEDASCDSADGGLDTVPTSVWSSASSAGGEKDASKLIQIPQAAAPTKMVIGTFDIDDLGVQTALKIQLLSGEIRRVGCLIDQFALHNFENQCAMEESAAKGVHDLFQSLDAWLRSEHSKVANTVKAKLRELNR